MQRTFFHNAMNVGQPIVWENLWLQTTKQNNKRGPSKGVEKPRASQNKTNKTKTFRISGRMKNAAWNNAPLDMDLLNVFVVVVEKPEVVQ